MVLHFLLCLFAQSFICHFSTEFIEKTKTPERLKWLLGRISYFLKGLKFFGFFLGFHRAVE